MCALPVRRPRTDLRRDLAKLALGVGPFLSVYLDVSPGSVRSSAATRLSDALDGLEGVSEVQRVEVATCLERVHEDDCLLVALIDANGNHVTTGYPDPPRTDLIELGNLPRLAPILVAEQALMHHVVAIVHDRQLTLLTVPRHGEPTQSSYSGSDEMAIAPVIHHTSRASQTRLVVLCGSSTELPNLEAQVRSGLPVEVSLATVATDELSDGELSAEIVVRAATHSAKKTVELLRLWRFHHAYGEAVTGVEPTLDALRDGRAGLLLIQEESADERRGLFGPDPSRVALKGERAAPVSPDERLIEGRLNDVIIRAAIAVGCPVHITPRVENTLEDGMGVILAERADPGELAALLEL